MLARKDTSKDIIALACKEKCPVDNPTTRIDQIVRALNSALLIGTAEHESEKSGDCVAMESALVISSGSNQLGLDKASGRNIPTTKIFRILHLHIDMCCFALVGVENVV